MFLNKHSRNWFNSATSLIILFVIFLSWHLLPTPKNSKPLPERLTSNLGLPAANVEKAIIIGKNQTRQRLADTDNKDEEPIYYSITNQGNQTIKPHVVINERDWFTSKSITDLALKNLDHQKTDNENKVLTLLNFIVKNRYHWTPPLYETSYHFLENPVQYLNSWGYGYCSNSASVLNQLLSLAGYDVRLVNLVEHVISEVFYDNSWHAIDPDLEVYYRNVSGTIASVEDIVAAPPLLDHPIWLSEVDEITKKVVKEVHTLAFSQPAQRNTPVSVSMTSPEYQDELNYHLRPEEEIRFYYNFPGKYYWGYSDKRPPEFTNGLLISQNKGGYYLMELPYPIVAAYISGSNLCRALVKPRFSLDGIHWKKLTQCQDDIISLTDLFPSGTNTRPTEKYQLVLPLNLIDYQLITQFQAAPRSIPKIDRQENDILIKEPLPADLKIGFGYWRVY